VLSLKHKNSFKPSCFDCFICSKYCTGIFSPESSGSFYIRSFSYIYIASFAPASSVVQSRQLMLPLSAALVSREVLQRDPRLREQSGDCDPATRHFTRKFFPQEIAENFNEFYADFFVRDFVVIHRTVDRCPAPTWRAIFW
jgi:hypothetical protein